MKLSKKQLLDYDKQGYVIVNNVFSKKDLEELDRAIKNILLIEKTKLDIKKKYENKNNSNKNIFLSAPNQIAKLDKYKLTGLTDTISENMQFKRISSSRKIQSIVNILLKEKLDNPLYGYINRCRINLAEDSLAELGWHREIFQTIPRASFVQIWAPLLQDSNKRNGALQIIPGSHNKTLPKPRWSSNKNLVSKVFYSSKLLENYEVKHIQLKLGQAIFFSGRLLHKSGKNTSNAPRYSIVGLYHNINDKKFIPPKASFSYRGETPKEYFDSFHKIL